MIIYHGSIVIVEQPEIRISNVKLDFGNGFYTTSSYNQAQRWAQIKMRRLNKTVGFVSKYEFDIDNAERINNIRRFTRADLEQEDKKIWYYSTPMLYELYKHCEVNSQIDYPDV